MNVKMDVLLCYSNFSKLVFAKNRYKLYFIYMLTCHMVRSLYATVSPQQKKGETRNPKCHKSRTMHFASFVCDFSVQNPEIIVNTILLLFDQ